MNAIVLAGTPFANSRGCEFKFQVHVYITRIVGHEK